MFSSQTNIQKQNTVQSIGIERIEIVDDEDVYNMEVEDNHNFIINGGLVVHNCMDAMRYFCETINITHQATPHRMIWNK